jgi:hypothetical protein
MPLLKLNKPAMERASIWRIQSQDVDDILIGTEQDAQRFKHPYYISLHRYELIRPLGEAEQSLLEQYGPRKLRSALLELWGKRGRTVMASCGPVNIDANGSPLCS